jgi:hypothetical protein
VDRFFPARFFVGTLPEAPAELANRAAGMLAACR